MKYLKAEFYDSKKDLAFIASKMTIICIIKTFLSLKIFKEAETRKKFHLIIFYNFKLRRKCHKTILNINIVFHLRFLTECIDYVSSKVLTLRRMFCRIKP